MNKSTPNSSKASGGISKNYFTPCKRVGLAPIRKSSGSLSNKSLSNSSIKCSNEFSSPLENSNKTTEISDLKEVNSTPVSSKEYVSEPSDTKKVNKKSLKKVLNQSDENNKVEAKNNLIELKKDTAEVKNDKILPDNTISDLNSTNTNTSEKPAKKNPIKTMKSKSVKRTLSLKKTSSCNSISDDDFQENKAKKMKTEIREFKIQLNRLTNVDSPKKLSSAAKLNKISKTLFPLSSTSSSEEEDFTSSPETAKAKKRQLIKQIKSLEKDIKDKHDNLDKLKRAETYKKVHNIEELENLTGIWKVGLEMAFNDLYCMLQRKDSSFNKDKETFLDSVNIPREIKNKLDLL